MYEEKMPEESQLVIDTEMASNRPTPESGPGRDHTGLYT